MTVPDDTLTAALVDVLGGGAPAVVWTDAGSEVLVHCAQARLTAVPGEEAAVQAAVPLESVETGRIELHVLMTLGPDGDPTVAAAATTPPGLLTTRWGRVVEDAVHTALASATAASAAPPQEDGTPRIASPRRPVPGGTVREPAR